RRLTVALAAVLRLFRHGSAALMAVRLPLLPQARELGRTASRRPTAARRLCRQIACPFQERQTRSVSPAPAIASRALLVPAALTGPTLAEPSQDTSPHPPAVPGRQPSEWEPLAVPARAFSASWLTRRRGGCARPCARSTWSPWQVARSPRFSWAWPTTSAQAQA